VRRGAAALPLWKAPRKACAIEWRIENIVFEAPTSIAPTAIGRIWLYQIENTTVCRSAGPFGVASCPARPGLRKRASGTSTSQLRTPPAKLMAESSKPMM